MLNVGYLDAEFEEFLVGCTPPSAGCTTDVSSLNEPINSPDWTTFLGATYEWELGVGDLAAHVGYQYRGETKVANTIASITDQDAYDVLDLGVAYTTASQAWRFALEGKNILDEEYRVAGYDFGNRDDDRRLQPDRLLRSAAHRRRSARPIAIDPPLPSSARAGEGAL